MGTLLVLAGLYLVWFALRVAPFNYPNKRLTTSKDKQIYWGAMPVFLMGVIAVVIGFNL